MIDAISVYRPLTRTSPPEAGKPSRGGQAENSKAQISNTKQITMTEIKNPKHAQDIEKRTYQNYS
jgi:hypothetical protein